MTGLLGGIRVVECSMLLNGAATSMMLADLGAEVIKVESPFLGDYIRVPDTMHLHRQVNRGKRSIAVDLRKDEGKAIFARLIEKADVFVTNSTLRRAEKLGYDVSSVRAVNPRIVYCQNTGYGATGPYRDVPTHGQMMDAMAGAIPVAMTDEGLVEPDPKYVRRTASLASGGEGTAAGAIYSAFHIAAALVHRDRTGQGCYLDTSSAAAVVSSAWTGACAMLNVPGRDGWWQDPANTRPIARYQAYRTSDGCFVLVCPEERRFWQDFCDAVGRPDLLDRQRGVDLRLEMQKIIEAKPRDYWMQVAVERNIPIGPIHETIDEVRTDPQIDARALFLERGDFVHMRQPVLVDGHPSAVGGEAPGLGDDTAQILAELGYGSVEMAAFAAAQVTAAPVRAEGHISRAIYGSNDG